MSSARQTPQCRHPSVAMQAQDAACPPDGRLFQPDVREYSGPPSSGRPPMPATPPPRTRTVSEACVIDASRICVTFFFSFKSKVLSHSRVKKKSLKSGRNVLAEKGDSEVSGAEGFCHLPQVQSQDLFYMTSNITGDFSVKRFGNPAGDTGQGVAVTA